MSQSSINFPEINENFKTLQIDLSKISITSPEGITQTTDKILVALIAVENLLRNARDNGDREANKLLKQKLVTRALLTGSFDPFTYGHQEIVSRALKIYDQVVIAIGVHSEKHPIFSMEERKAIILRECKDYEDRIKVIPFTGALVDLALHENCQTILRGVRNVTDFQSETTIALINRELSNGQVETQLLIADPKLSLVSSSDAKRLIILGKDASTYVSDETERDVKNRLAKKSLSPIWEKLFSSLTSNIEGSEKLFNKLCTKYEEPHRYYRNLDHLYRLFKLFEQVKDLVKYPNSLALAIFFHDVIYQPKNSDNELQSAEFLKQELSEIGIAPEIINQAYELILRTKDHQTENVPDANILLTLDLAILASPDYKTYENYALNIRREFQHVPLAEYQEKRAAVLENFARRPIILPNPELIGLTNGMAKANLEDEITSLRAKVFPLM